MKKWALKSSIINLHERLNKLFNKKQPKTFLKENGNVKFHLKAVKLGDETKYFRILQE